MFNPLCNSKINNVLRDGGAGRIESKTLTFDGNTDGKFIFGGVFVKVADEVADLSSVVYLSWFCSSDGAVEEYTDGFQVDSTTIPFGDVLNYDGNPWVLIVHENAEAYEKGTYFYCKDGEYVSVLKTETIHPIDPKFLPGEWLDLNALGMTELPASGNPFSAEIGEEKAQDIISKIESDLLLGITCSAQVDGIPCAVKCKILNSNTYEQEGAIVCDAYVRLAAGNLMLEIVAAPGEGGEIILSLMG